MKSLLLWGFLLGSPTVYAETPRNDLQLTADIRRSLIKDKSLSMEAHNVQILSEHGMVTLKGSVANETERDHVTQIATTIAGPNNVKAELSVKAPSPKKE